jgi:hypothetical protein
MTEEENQSETTSGFYEIDDKLYFTDNKGDMFRLDFDINKKNKIKKSKQQTIKNYIEDENDMTNDTEDITNQQVRENYWHETSQTKLDGSTMMMETRISKCVEAGGTLEECSKKVKSEMKNKGSENTNTEDIEDIKEEEEEEEEEEETKKEDICPKKLDMLKEKAAKYDALQAENESLKGDMKSFQEDFLVLKKEHEDIMKERNEEIEFKRQEKIKQISTDFDIPIEEIQDDTIEELEKFEKRIDMALKRDKEVADGTPTEDMTQYISDMEKRGQELMAKYKLS